MSKMSEIYLWFKDIEKRILIICIVLIFMNVISIMRNNQVEKLEQRLTKQEEYMHQVQADIDNLYRVVE